MSERRSVLTRIFVVVTGLPMLVVCVMMMMGCVRLLMDGEHAGVLILGMLLWHVYWAIWLGGAVTRAMSPEKADE